MPRSKIITVDYENPSHPAYSTELVPAVFFKHHDSFLQKVLKNKFATQKVLEKINFTRIPEHSRFGHLMETLISLTESVLDSRDIHWHHLYCRCWIAKTYTGIISIVGVGLRGHILVLFLLLLLDFKDIHFHHFYRRCWIVKPYIGTISIYDQFRLSPTNVNRSNLMKENCFSLKTS